MGADERGNIKGEVNQQFQKTISYLFSNIARK
jgi:hypothetical protein